MSIGQGIAICGIWGGTAAIAFSEVGGAVILVGMFAMIATGMISTHKQGSE